MPKTHDFGPFHVDMPWLKLDTPELFWHRQRYPSRKVQRGLVIPTPPLTEESLTNELYEPWRTAHGRVFRLPLTRQAIVLGYWDEGDPFATDDDEREKLTAAIEGASIPGITATEISEWDRAIKPVWLRAWEMLRDAFLNMLHSARGEGDSGYPEGVTYTEWSSDPDIPDQGEPAPLIADAAIVDLMPHLDPHHPRRDHSA